MLSGKCQPVSIGLNMFITEKHIAVSIIHVIITVKLLEQGTPNPET